jgi:hypothetical protein
MLVLAHGHEVTSYEDFEQTRRESGMFLGQAARPGDVVQTCYGYFAFGASQTTIKENCPLSSASRWRNRGGTTTAHAPVMAVADRRIPARDRAFTWRGRLRPSY